LRVKILKPNYRIPQPSRESARVLIHECSPAGFVIPPWMEELVIVAYQNGRYDEACAETVAAALD
jgi:hypothetical protein